MVDDSRINEFNGRVAQSLNGKNESVYVFIKSGRLKYSDGTTDPYLHVYLAVLSDSQEWTAWDSLETEDLDDLSEELRSGSLDWYGETLNLSWLGAEEAAPIIDKFGWSGLI
ncbi:hypothetical protein PS9374_05601 [Planomonospora sphaerica]|uniref:Uncharacterized protein n=1 Tax=Planomonospora sphaerica TaxID=161355 RepID=A0A171DLY3_9ACTN|nr:hypothetical protein [Planomonospora sphaerica]GAT69921.1 hypothetical protein PS9374_05601 [Planomonospora sphaerica]